MEQEHKYLLFDFDGTLFDTQLDILAAINAVRGRNELKLFDPQKVNEFIGYGSDFLIRRSFQDLTEDPVRLKTLYLEFHDYYMTHPTDHVRYYPNVEEILPTLENKIILSNKPEDLVVKILDTFKITNQFLHVFGGDSFPVKKPDPELMDAMIEKTGLKDLRASSIMIGDGQPDHDFAKHCKLPYFCCNYGFSNVIGDYEIMQRIDSFEEILKYLQLD